jgi:glycosyltransferase involved in cell wall biosynthesis
VRDRAFDIASKIKTMNALKASVVIATKDRKDELQRALASAMQQTVDVEIIVLDDGSIDGTSETIRAAFPNVRLDVSPLPLGQSTQRNRGARLASNEIVFSIDDDAEFSTSKVVEQTLAAFCHPRVAAVAIPYVEPHRPEQHQKAIDEKSIWVTDSFRGTAYAIRREVFLRLGGYREQIVGQNEEPDFCIRLLNSGFVIALGTGDNIVHHESPKRSWTRQDFHGRRNDILFAWRNVPMPYLPPHLLGTTANGLRHAIATRSISDLKGLSSGLRDIFLNGPDRSPVSQATYRLHRWLKKRGPKVLDEIEALLPPLSA